MVLVYYVDILFMVPRTDGVSVCGGVVLALARPGVVAGSSNVCTAGRTHCGTFFACSFP